MSKARDLADASPVANGQCRFRYASPTECRLLPFGGNGMVAGGVQVRIPNAGLALSNTALQGAVGTTNYVYLALVGGVPVLEASTVTHANGPNGIEIKNGDPTRTFVGIAYHSTGGQFIDAPSLRGVASWYNRYYKAGQFTNFNTGTASTSPVQAMNPVYIWCWAGEGFTSCVNGRAYVNVAGATAYVHMHRDGVEQWAAGATSATANASVPINLYAISEEMTEGFHSISTALSTQGGGTSNCALNQSILGRPS